jgi:hypothetical protein
MMIVVGCVAAGGILVAARQQARPAVTTIPRPEMSAPSTAAPRTLTASTSTDITSVRTVPAAPKASPVTITGCLERADGAFRLKDTSGPDAPRARSWKSGFIKKGSATIDIVDRSRTLKLADQVGRRVSVTGTLDDREMHARSVRRVASTCDRQP